jgi:TolA-binding protein
MTPFPRLGGFIAAVGLTFAILSNAAAQPQMPPDKQAALMLAAGQKAYNDSNLSVATERFQELLRKFANTPSANAARYGLALCLVNSPQQDFARAIENLNHPANDGGFAERGSAAYQLAVCQRALGLKELEKPAHNPNEENQHHQAARPRFNEAERWFTTARDWFAGKKDDNRAARCRCDIAEMQLRLNKVKEARATTEPFTKDDALAKNKYRPLGLYYHGLACFLDHDRNTAGRSLNQLAPFDDPAFGLHAQYLVGRVLQLSGENAEASVHYDAVLTDYAKRKKDAAQALNQPNKFKNNPFEKHRLEVLAKGPPPEYVAGAAFHGASLHYEAGRFADALTRFQAFAREYADSPLQPDAQLRAGFCLVQLKQYDEAAKLLQPLADKTPRLADQALYWLGKAQLGAAQTDDAKTRNAINTLKRAVEKANQNDPETKNRRSEIRFDLADAMQSARQFKEAAQQYEQLWHEQALPQRREELLQRLASARGAAGEIDPSTHWAAEFRKQFPHSVLLPAVMLRQAENAFARATQATKDRNRAAELKQRLEDAALKYKEVIDKFPEFEQVNFARYGLGLCYAQLGRLEDATKALEAIPAPDRAGELSAAAYILADCLIRQAPAKAEDALQENQVREKLTTAAQLLETFLAANPKAPEAPAALLKLGHCQKRLGATLADANERNQTLNRARETYEKLSREHAKDPLAGQARLEQAKVKALLGDKGGATNDLRQFSQNAELRKSPVAPLAALHLATLLREQNNPTEAAKILDEARKHYDGELARDPERAEWAPMLKYHQAVALFESGKPTDARKLFEQVIQQPVSKAVGAEAALRAGQCRVATAKKQIEAARQARAQAGKDARRIATAERMEASAKNQILQAADELMNRAERFRNTPQAAAASARMRYDAAWVYRGLATDEVAAAWEQLKKQADGKPVPRGKVPMQRGEERAFGAYRKLIDDFPDMAMATTARFELAELQAERGENDAAIALLKDAADKEPTDSPVPPETIERIRLRLGAALAAKKDYAAAAAQFEAVAGNPKSPYLAQALDRAGECLLAAGEPAKAAERLAVFRDKGEFNNIAGVSDRALLRLGQALAATKDWDKSRQTFELFLQRFGNSPLAADARYGVGWALQHQSKYDAAVSAYQQVIAATASETAAKAQLQIGQCHLMRRKPAEAALAFLVVPYTYDAYPEVGYAAILEAARAFVENKQPDQAERVLKKFAEDAPPGSEWATAAKERLEKLQK